jgi:tRNA (cytidine/uridine-2'-O-)-methyltransferase
VTPGHVLDLVLYRPAIPPNTGNIMRLCANTGARLHLVGPIAFDLSDAAVRRAGLDYRDQAVVTEHADWAAARAALPGRWFAVDTSGTRRYDEARFALGDVLLFGTERTGLPGQVLAEFDPDAVLRIPMLPCSRSLNLSNAVALVAYEAWRQLGFPGGR